MQLPLQKYGKNPKEYDVNPTIPIKIGTFINLVDEKKGTEKELASENTITRAIMHA